MGGIFTISFTMNKLKILFLFILIVPFAIADWHDDGSCQRNTNCTISRLVINETNGLPIINANCTVAIYDPDGFPVVNETQGNPQMINTSHGYYNYTINYNVDGKYPADMACNDTFGTATIDTADITFTIGLTHYNNYLYTFLVLIPIGLFLLGWRKQNATFIMLSGMLLVVFGVAIYGGLFPYFSWDGNLITKAFTISVFGIGAYIMMRQAIEYSKEAAIG